MTSTKRNDLLKFNSPSPINEDMEYYEVLIPLPEQRGLCHLQFSQPVISKPMYWLFFSLTPIRKLCTGGYNYILVGVM